MDIAHAHGHYTVHTHTHITEHTHTDTLTETRSYCCMKVGTRQSAVDCGLQGRNWRLETPANLRPAGKNPQFQIIPFKKMTGPDLRAPVLAARLTGHGCRRPTGHPFSSSLQSTVLTHTHIHTHTHTYTHITYNIQTSILIIRLHKLQFINIHTHIQANLLLLPAAD